MHSIFSGVQTQKNEKIQINLKSSFNEFEYCFDRDQIDERNDRFQLESTSEDAVCITSLTIDGKQILVGNNNDMQSFWIDDNENNCLDDFTGTSQITIQNGIGSVRLGK